MSSRRPALLLVIGGALLIANPMWLVPHEGETRYTYERSEIVVENDTFTYNGDDVRGLARENSLNPVGCEYRDEEQPRACAFDRHLADHGPVAVERNGFGSIRPEFVRIDGSYYRRIHRLNRSSENRTVTHDVERVSPRTVLAESATDVSGLSRSDVDDLGLAFQVAVTGESVTSFQDLEGDELGNVYRDGGTYYTVVATDVETVDHGLDTLRYELPRYLLAGVGVLLAIGGVLAWYPAND